MFTINSSEGALYIHIPFCRHKCIYCDFYSIITTDNFENFLNAIKKEIREYSSRYSEGNNFASVFFGGGTPSIMPPGYIKEILDELRNGFTISNKTEITLETNPGTVNPELLALFREAGINRLSVGIQSFDRNDLEFLTRIHSEQDAVNTIINAKEAGFENISLDLIFNLPGQTKAKWKENLEKAVALPVNHISAYSLILERGTILSKMVIDGKVKIEDADFDAELYSFTIDFLAKNGFRQYEVSNFAKPDMECRHNLAYWQYKNYIGFGPSAHSFFNGQRWWNYTSLKLYIANIIKSGRAVMGSEKLTSDEMFEEFLMLSLRSRGLNIESLEKAGMPLNNEQKQYLESLEGSGLLKIADGFIALTPAGYAVCDEIISKLISIP
jgi:oxygen-independent coproporphyrinogen-3 oxidase